MKDIFKKFNYKAADILSAAFIKKMASFRFFKHKDKQLRTTADICNDFAKP